MERFALAGLLVLVVPSLAPAQRVEIAVLGGAYQPAPRVWEVGSNCYEWFRPDPSCTIGRLVRGIGTAIGGRLTVQLGERFGVDAVVQHARASNQIFPLYSNADPDDPGGLQSPAFDPEQITATFVALQAHIRRRLNDALELRVAGGPARSSVQAVTARPSGAAETRSGARAALALSAGVRAQIGSVYACEITIHDYLYLDGIESRAGSWHDLTLSVGLVFALWR